MNQMEQMSDAPDSHYLDRLTSQVSSLFYSPETSFRTSPTSAQRLWPPTPL